MDKKEVGEVVSFRAEPDLLERLKRLAASEDRTVAAQVKRLVMQGLRKVKR